jgi:regulator of protease activity HflC (stomatin/prohibitin superfamily)
MSSPETNQPKRGDPYRSVVIVLLAASALGVGAAIWGGIQLWNPVLFAVAVTIGLAAGVLAGVATAQAIRLHPAPSAQQFETKAAAAASGGAETQQAEIFEAPVVKTKRVGDEPAAMEGAGVQPEAPPDDATPRMEPGKELRAGLATLSERLSALYSGRGTLRAMRDATAVVGAVAVWVLLGVDTEGFQPYSMPAAIAIGLCLLAAAIAATTVKYFGDIAPERLPEAAGLRRGARVMAWIFLFAALSTGLAWLNQRMPLKILYWLILLLDAALCYGLWAAKGKREEAATVYPLDLGVLAALGSRNNLFGSALDAAERQLGIDLRSTWALAVLRRGLEPLAVSLVLVGWLSTSWTVVGIQEQGLVARLGVPVGGEALGAGLHLHLPWPIDKVMRIPVRRVETIEVGHEGEEKPGPENVLWAVAHAPNEFTLLLGNGRDLITVDAGVHYRISDPRAYRYSCQNPAQALSAMAYRAVMRNTVNLTLSDALSQNVAILTSHMRQMIQADADEMGLGVEVLGFTVGGMHPPVAVAKDYQGVISAEVKKVTRTVQAQVYRVRVLPEAEASALMSVKGAQAEAAAAMGKAAGEAWSFRTLESQFRASPKEYFFRRRLETLEKGLANRGFTLVDARFERDGGELWVIP